MDASSRYHQLPSPAASASSAITSLPHISSCLPPSRVHPLKPGSPKEIALINYVDDKMLRITRRYAKKFSSEKSKPDEAPGYVSYDEVVRDLDAVFDVVWISGTPAIQTPYLLSIAGDVASYMPAFTFSTSLFAIVKKLDMAFSRLLQMPSMGLNDNTEVSGYRLSPTEKVRIKSLIQETRVVAVDLAASAGLNANAQDLYDTDDTTDEDTDADVEMTNVDSTEAIMAGLSRIYRQTMDILGDTLG